MVHHGSMPEEHHQHHPEHHSSHPVEFSDIKTYLSWNAPGRPYKSRGRQYFLSILLLVFLVEIILFLFAEYQLMMAAGALAFLSIALAAVPPSQFHYRISSEGVKIEDHFYIWKELYDFYFKKIEGVEVLVIRTQDLIPGELKLPLEGVSRDHVRKVLLHFLPYREVVRATFMEKSADWLSHNFPLEDPRRETSG
jgi:hypothetical protein